MITKTSSLQPKPSERSSVSEGVTANTASNKNSEKILIRISPNIRVAPEAKVRDLSSAVDATSGIHAKTGTSFEKTEESARLLWRRGTDSVKLEKAINESSGTLNAQDKEGLLKVASELRKLETAYPQSSESFKEASGKSNHSIEKIKDKPFDTSENQTLLENQNGDFQLSESEWSDPKDFESSYFDDAKDFIDDLQSYARDMVPDKAFKDYIEPDVSPPPSRSGSLPSQREPVSFSDVVSKGGNALGKTTQHLAKRTFNSAKLGSQKAIKKGLGKLLTSIAPFLAKTALIAGAALAIILGLMAWIAIMIVICLAIAFGMFLFVAFSLLIINSGAYMVPPGADLEMYQAYGTFGTIDCDLEPGCPCGWPVRTDNQMTYYVSQGPQVDPIKTWCTHFGLEAIDVSSRRSPNPIDVIISTQQGTITNIGIDYNGGLWLEISSTCNGNPVRAWHVHFDSFAVSAGQAVERGTVLGIMGTTGYSSGPHDHYEFRQGAVMAPPHLPVAVPYGCCGATECGITIP